MKKQKKKRKPLVVWGVVDRDGDVVLSEFCRLKSQADAEVRSLRLCAFAPHRVVKFVEVVR
jgi:hypothetical protein